MRIIFILIFAVSFPAWACKLPPKTRLVVACTYKCPLAYSVRLKLSARALGYDIDVVELGKLGPLKEAIKKVDAVLIPGGADINPDYYSDKVTPELHSYLQKNRSLAHLNEESAVRDPYELEFIKNYLEDQTNSSLPLLGICRGMQIMSVAQGIPLYLDIKTELGFSNRRYVFDLVHLEKNTRLDSIYVNDSFRGFKMHHQGLRVPYYKEHASDYPDVKVTAFSHEGQIAEGIEYQSRPAIGIQYHPEKSFTGTAAPIFRWLLTRSCEHKNAKVSE
ncbi:MAG: gamma-glutamyl-gamma-aminobutyrate hydrolase family protein [Bacteriovoracaceae bacterium]